MARGTSIDGESLNIDMLSFATWLRENYGNVIFAPDRLDVSQPPEPNTPEEDEAWKAFRQHYLGGRDGSLIANLPQILVAKAQGKYKEFLDVPDNYKFAYRLMADVPASTLVSAFGFNPKTQADVVNGVINGGTYSSSLSRVSSWTVDVAALPQLVKDFGGLYRKHEHSYHLLLHAKLDENHDAFLINPDKYQMAPELAGQFSYQKEIISFAPVTLWKTIYCDKNAFAGNDDTIVEWLISQTQNVNV